MFDKIILQEAADILYKNSIPLQLQKASQPAYCRQHSLRRKMPHLSSREELQHIVPGKNIHTCMLI